MCYPKNIVPAPVHKVRCTAIILGLILLAAGVKVVEARNVGHGANGSVNSGHNALTLLHEVIMTGSRERGITVSSSASPVQLVSDTALKAVAGNPTLLAALSQLVPSFTAQVFGNDMAAQTLQAKLRGLGCNEVLVLVNGKIRHTSANIEVDSGPFQGCAAADLGFIPIDSIARIEVLTDGAAAQYGSGAIAGVINIILKKRPSGATASYTYGGYRDGGGDTSDISVNGGFRPIRHSYLNITAEAQHHGSSNRSGIDEQVINPENLATYPDSNMLNAPGYPHLGAEEGDAQSDVKLLEFNAGVKGPGNEHLYAFGTYGHKQAQAFQIYRMPNVVSYTNPTTNVTTYPFPLGFTPLEASRETDYSVTAGIKGLSAKWRWDFSTEYGRDHFDVYTLNSANSGAYASNGQAQPLNFYDGYMQATQWITNLDINRSFNVGMSGPVNVAFGFQYSRDSYVIGAGMPLSYVEGGAQGYPGFAPSDSGSHNRHVEAFYVDLAAQPLKRFRVDVAGRYDLYSDFGSATVGKLTARYDFTPRVALRGTISSGFRAPTLAEEYYSSTNVEVGTAFVQLAPNLPGAKLLGLGDGLQPEHSVNFSAGFVWRPRPSVVGTLDLYQINVTHRIVATGDLYGTLFGVAQPSAAAVNAAIVASGTQLVPSVLASGSTGVTLFANGIDTSTQGADAAVDFRTDNRFGRFDWSLRGTYNRTQITKVPVTPRQLSGLTPYDATALSDLTSASPRYVMEFGVLWRLKSIAINLEEQLYGESSEWENDDGDNPSKQPEYFKTTIGVTPITDVELSYHFFGHFILSIGALNLLDRYPNRYNSTLLAHYNTFRYEDVAGVFQYPMFSPFGINGGYYYVRGTARF